MPEPLQAGLWGALGLHYLAPLGGDWIALPFGLGQGPVQTQTSTWFSADGLGWADLATIELAAVSAGDATLDCREFPSGLTSSGGWLALATTLSYPCSEGGFVIFGTQRISTDGATWEDLPFAPGTPGTARSGSHVLGSVAVDGALVLVGESNGRAAFWIGDAP